MKVVGAFIISEQGLFPFFFPSLHKHLQQNQSKQKNFNQAQSVFADLFRLQRIYNENIPDFLKNFENLLVYIRVNSSTWILVPSNGGSL